MGRGPLLAWATRISTDIGRGFGYLFIGLGIAMFIFQGSFSGAWLAFIGWFLLQAANAEARYIATEAALNGLRVRDLMVRNPVTVDGDLTVGQFMDEVARSRRFTTYPVVDAERPIGLLAFSSLAALPRSEWDSQRVRDTMIPLDEVPLFKEDTTAIDALAAAGRGLIAVQNLQAHDHHSSNAEDAHGDTSLNVSRSRRRRTA